MRHDVMLGPGAVYHHVNAEGKILYIGCTVNPMARFAIHRSQSSWAKSVVRIDIHWFPTMAEALVEERRQIESICPPFNRQYSGRGPANYRTNLGHQHLSKWMSETGVTERDLARHLAVSSAIVRSLFNPRARPQMNALIPHQATGE